MKFGILSSRKDIKGLSKKEEDLIDEWLSFENWSSDDFAKFLNLLEVRTPVRLLKSDLRNNFFNFRAKDGKEFSLKLVFGDLGESLSEIHITRGPETKCYVCPSKSRANCIPTVKYISSVIQKNGKILETTLNDYMYNVTLLINSEYCLALKFDFSNPDARKIGELILEQSEDLENLIFSQDVSLDVEVLLEKIQAVSGFTKEDMNLCEKISISFKRSEDLEKSVISCLKLNHGSVKEYAKTIDSETFHVYKDNNWRYASKDVRILYRESTKKYIFSILGTEEDLYTVKLSDMLPNVINKISEFQKVLK